MALLLWLGWFWDLDGIVACPRQSLVRCSFIGFIAKVESHVLRVSMSGILGWQCHAGIDNGDGLSCIRQNMQVISMPMRA
jgi:hypothetical protein